MQEKPTIFKNLKIWLFVWIMFGFTESSLFSLWYFDPKEHIASQEIGDKDDHHPFTHKKAQPYLLTLIKNKQKDYLCTWNRPLQDQSIEKGKEHISWGESRSKGKDRVGYASLYQSLGYQRRTSKEQCNDKGSFPNDKTSGCRKRRQHKVVDDKGNHNSHGHCPFMRR